MISHMADLSLSHTQSPRNESIFGIEQFVYDLQNDTYRCPAGQTLTRRKHKKQRQAYEYACAASTCRACSLRGQCTRAQGGGARTIKRHYAQEAIDAVPLDDHILVGIFHRDRVIVGGARPARHRCRLSPHTFRNTIESRMNERGATFKEIADILGHQQIDTVSIYAKVNIGQLGGN